jgi:hypothetical protein
MLFQPPQPRQNGTNIVDENGRCIHVKYRRLKKPLRTV